MRFWLMIGWAVNVVMAAMIPELIAVSRRRSGAMDCGSVDGEIK